jgi:hypothetical protein
LQDRIHENFVENPKKLKASADCKRSVTSYQRPFFMDKNGNVSILLSADFNFIILTCGRHLHDCIILLRWEVWAHKTV